MFLLESEIYRLTAKLRQLEAFSLLDTKAYKETLIEIKEKATKLKKAKAFFNQEMLKHTKGYLIESSYKK